jgi:hypothetical protein
MLNRILIYGTMSGLAVGAMLYATTAAPWGMPHGGLGMLIGYTTMLIALSLVFVGIKRQRDDAGGGVIRFWPAFGMGIGISVVAGIFYVLAWELAQATTASGFIESYTAALMADKKASGASTAELARYAAEMRAFAAQYANPLFRLPMTFAEIFPVGVLVSLVSAALLRNPRFLPARRDTASA